MKNLVKKLALISILTFPAFFNNIKSQTPEK